MQYAGFWRRFVASFIDGLIISVAIGIVVFATGFGLGGLVDPGRATPEELNRVAAGGYVLALVVTALWIVYFAAFESSARQATPGKMALGIVVTGATGQRIGFGQAAARNAAKMLSSAILLIGYLMAAFTSRKQALHDMLTGCLVIRR
jgi:uncharacterized RDD family membrane protein YckC